MMTDQEFINVVWNKYDNYLCEDFKDNFFTRNQYKHIRFNNKLSLVFNFILSLIVTTGIVYAGITAYEFIQKNTSTDFNKNRGYNYSQNMIYSNSMYYKKIYNYEEYLEAKKIWNNLVEIEPEEFNDYFIIIIAGENYDTTSLYISNAFIKNEELYIELKKTDVWDGNNTVISTKIPKELDKEKVNLINLPNEVSLYKDIKIEDISEEYTIDEAIKDNCFVVDENNNIISSNQEQLNNFVNNCNNKVNDYIRIYLKEPERIVIHDIEYKNNKINMVSKEINSNKNEIYYRTGNKITIRKEESSTTYYRLSDEIGNGTIFCILNF